MLKKTLFALTLLLGAFAFTAKFPVWGPGDFLSSVPPCVGHRRSLRSQSLRVFFPGSKFSGFDTPIALAGNVDRECRVLEPIADGIGDDGIGDHFAPMIN